MIRSGVTDLLQRARRRAALLVHRAKKREGTRRNANTPADPTGHRYQYIGSVIEQALEGAEQGDAKPLLASRPLILAAGLQAEYDTALVGLISRLPRVQGQLSDVCEALRYGSTATALRFQGNLRAQEGDPLDLDPLEVVIDELALIEAYQEGHDAFQEERARVMREGVQSRRAMSRALHRVGAWVELAHFFESESVKIGRSAPDLEAELGPQIRTSTRKAMAAGSTGAAFRLAKVTLSMKPGHDEMQAIKEEADDQLTVLQEGWKWPSRESTPYHLDPRSVLSVLGQSLPIRSGGYATRSHGLIAGLRARGWNVQGVTRLGFPYDQWWKPDDPRPVPLSEAVDDVTYHRLLLEGVREYPQFPLEDYVEVGASGVAALAISQRAALIHAASLYDVGMAGLTAARRLGLPFIYEMRGLRQLMELSRDPSFVSSERHQFLEMMETGIAREADRVLVITEALRSEMTARGVDDDRIKVVPNGVDTERFHPRPRDAELERALRLEGKAVIGYIGSLVHYEGVELLLEAAASLNERRKDFHLLIVGDGQHERIVRIHAHRLRIGDVVTFVGRVSRAEVQRYLSLVDIAPIPRLPLPVCELISPIKPFEAMAMGKVVVASDVAALAEIIEDGVTGRLFRKGDSADLTGVLDQLLNDPEQRRSLGAAGRNWVKRERDWVGISKVVDDAYWQLIDDGGPSDATGSPQRQRQR